MKTLWRLLFAVPLAFVLAFPWAFAMSYMTGAPFTWGLVLAFYWVLAATASFVILLIGRG